MNISFLGKGRWHGFGPRRFDLGVLSLLCAAVVAISVGPAHGEAVDDVVEALRIRDYLQASEAQCRSAAHGQARHQVAASVSARLAGRLPSADDQARIEELSQTYAREACRLGIEDGLMQGYRAAYRAALTDSELAAALAFLSSPEGRSFAEAGLGANREVLPLIWRRQESQASRAAALLKSRLNSLLGELSAENSDTAPGAQ